MLTVHVHVVSQLCGDSTVVDADCKRAMQIARERCGDSTVIARKQEQEAEENESF